MRKGSILVANQRKINVSLEFTANTAQARAQMRDLQNQLNQLGNITASNNGFQGLEASINKSRQAALELQAALNLATNVNTGKLDLSVFNQQLKKAGKDINYYAAQLKAMGPEGTKAFISLAQSIQQAEMPTLRLSNLTNKLWQSLKNVATWQISSTALRMLYGGISDAWRYAQDLNESLNNIRIITGQNTDQMAKFAVQANKAAKALSTTTTDYTNASLIYYQQGLSDEEVAKRTEVTLKLANVSRQSAQEVSDQLTAIWNNFDDGTKSLEYYADVITKLGATTASSSEEIAGGLEKFSSIARTVGLSYEYATSMLATIVARTRQSEDTVGTGLRTILGRFESLQQGTELDDGISLTKYTQAIENIGVKVMDTVGNLRDMDSILSDVGDKWKDLSREEQTAFAYTVGGVRQYANLIALFDDWDRFQQNLRAAQTSEGTLQEQQEIYAESWEAARDRVKAAAESIYSDIIDDDFFIDLTNGLAKILDFIDKIIDSAGGLPGLLSGIAAIVTRIAAPQIANSFRGIAENINLITGKSRNNANQLKEDVNQALAEMGVSEQQRGSLSLVAEMTKFESQNAEKMTDAQKLILSIMKTQVSTMAQSIDQDIEKAENLVKELKLKEQIAKSEQVTLQRRQEELKLQAEERRNLEKQNLEEKKRAETVKLRQANMKMAEAGYSVANARSEVQNTDLQLQSRIGKGLDAYRRGIQKLRVEIQEELSQTTEEGLSESLEKKIQEYEKRLTHGVEKINKVVFRGEATPEQIKAIENYVKAVQQELKAVENVNKVIEERRRIQQQIDALKSKGSALNKQEEQSLNKLKQQEQEAAEKEKEFKKQVEEANKALDGQRGRLKNAEEGYRRFAQSAEESGNKLDWADRLTNVTQGVSSFAFALSSLKGLINTWQDEDTSIFDKLTSSLMSISFIIPNTISIFKNLSSAINSIKIGIEGLTLAQVKENSVKELALIIKKKNIGMTSAEALAKAREIKEHNGNTLSIVAETVAQKALNAAKAVGAVFTGKFGLALAGIAWGAAIAGVVALTAYIIKYNSAQERANRNLEAAKNNYKVVSEATKETQESVDNLKSSWDSLQNAQNTLKRLTSGTTEWKEALLKVNQQIIDIIDKYPELAGAVINTNGALSIDQSAYNQYLDKELQRYQNLQANQMLAQQSQISAQNEVYRQQIIGDTGKNIVFGSGTLSESLITSLGGVTSSSGGGYEDIDVDVNKIIDLFIDSNKYAEATQLIQEVSKTKDDHLIDLIQKIKNDTNKMVKQDEQEQLENRLLTRIGLTDQTYSEALGALMGQEYRNSFEKVRNEVYSKARFYGAGAGDTLDEQGVKGLISEYLGITDLSTIKLKTEFGKGYTVKVGDKDYGSLNDLLEPMIQAISESRYAEGFDTSKATSQLQQYYDEVAGVYTELGLSERQIYSIIADNLRIDEKNKTKIQDFTVFTREQLAQIKEDADLSTLTGLNDEKFDEALKIKREEITSINDTYLKDYAKNISEELASYMSQLELTSEDYEDYIELILKANKALEGNREAAERVVRANLRISAGLGKVNKAWENNKDILDQVANGEKDVNEAIHATNELGEAIQEWLGVELSDDSIRGWIADGTISKALEGEAEAIKQISTEASKQIAESFSVESQYQGIKDGLIQIANFIQSQDITIDTSINVDDAIEGLNWLLQTSQITADQATKYLQGIGYEPKITQKPVPGTSVENTWRMQVPSQNADGTWTTETLTGSFGMSQAMTVPIIESVDSASGTTYTGFTPSSFGSFSSKSSSSGGGSRSQKETKASNDEIDRYHYVKEVLEDISDELDKVSKAKDRAFSQDKLKAIDQEIKLYEKELKTQQQYIKQIEDWYQKDKSVMAGFGAVFDATGNISNYDALMQSYINQYNDAVSRYNAGSLTDDAFKAYEDHYAKFKDALSQYEETNKLLFDERETLQDIINTMADARLERIQTSVEIQVQVNDDALKLIDFYLDNITDHAYEAAEAIMYLGMKSDSVSRQFEATYKGLVEVLADIGLTEAAIEKLMTGDNSILSSMTVTNSQVEALRQYTDDLISYRDTLNDIRDNTFDALIQSFDSWNDKIERNFNEFNQLNKVVEHYQNVIEIIGKGRLGISNQLLRELRQASVDNSIQTVAAAKAVFDSIKTQRDAAEATLEEARRLGDEKEIKRAEDLYDQLNDKFIEATDELNNTQREALEKSRENFQQTMEEIIEDFQRLLTGGVTIDDALGWMNKYKEQREWYLDDLEKIVGLNALNRDIQKDIDASTNVKAQRELRDLQAEITDLQANGQKLSQYDLDYLRKRYELKKAELAVDQASNNATTARLRRDDEGNWGYVYTADQAKVDEARNEYEKKLLELRDLTNKHLDEISSGLLQLEKDRADAIKAIEDDLTLTTEQKLEEMRRINEFYDAERDQLIQQGEVALQNNQKLLAEANAHFIKGLDDSNNGFQAAIDDTLFGQAIAVSSFGEYANNAAQYNQEFFQKVQENLQQLEENNSKILDEAGNKINAYGSTVSGALSGITTTSNGLKDSIAELAKSMGTTLVDAINKVSNTMPGFVDRMGEITKQTEDAAKAVEALTTAYLNQARAKQEADKANYSPSNNSGQPTNPTVPSGGFGGGGGNTGWQGNSGQEIPSYLEGSIAENLITQELINRKGYDPGVDSYWGNRSNIGMQKYFSNYTGAKAVVANGYAILGTLPDGKRLQQSYGAALNGGRTEIEALLSALGLLSLYNKIVSQRVGRGGGTLGGSTLMTMATGGYTGDWGDTSGKLAVLHQKELVLNADDTKNFLSGVSILREITRSIDLQAAANMGALGTPIASVGYGGSQTLDQNVTIHAEFPNAVDHNEIEQALLNLTNTASQYANRRGRS